MIIFTVIGILTVTLLSMTVFLFIYAIVKGYLND